MMRMFELYYQYKKLPPKHSIGLKYMYELIMKDFREYEKNHEPPNFKDAYNEDANVYGPEISKRSYFIIDSILKNKNDDLVLEIIEKSIEEEKRQDNIEEFGLNVHVLVRDYITGIEETVRTVEKVIEDFTPDITEEEMVKSMLGKKDGDKLILPYKLLRLIYSTLLNTHRLAILEKNYKEIIKNKDEQYENMRAILLGDIKVLMDEVSRLKEELINSKSSNIQKVYIDQSDKIQALKDEYERYISELREEVESWKELALSLAREKQKIENRLNVEIEPFESPIYIAYFGMNNPQLYNMLANYNVFVKEYSPIDPPNNAPSFPIVFNIDVASHNVWDHIKDKKPLLISGSNAEVLSKKIIFWLKENKNRGA
jgi:hypothetical protein